MTRLLALVVTLILLLPGSIGVAEEIRIASWNIEWLNSDDDTGKVKRRQEDYDRLREYATILDADIIALQEIDDEAAVHRVFPQGRYNAHCSQRNNVQRTCIAYKDGLGVVEEPDLATLNVSGNVRHGTVIRIERTGSMLLRMMAVHLKSGCFTGDLVSPSGNNCPTLSNQVPILESWAESQTVPFMIVGDWNRRMQRPNDDLWADLDDDQPVTVGLEIVDIGAPPKCWGGEFSEFIDHIVVDGDAASMIVPSSAGQLVYNYGHLDFKGVLSDHCPIFVSININ